MGMISVLVAETHAAVRDAFAALLGLQADVTVVATASSVREGTNLAWLHQPDVALIDTQLPHDSGFAMVEQLAGSVPTCRAVMLAAADSPSHMRRAFDQGAWAYLSKHVTFAEIIDAIKQVGAGHRLIDPSQVDRASCSPLTARESEVLQQVALVGTTAAIAHNLHLSKGTVNNYVSSILTKLNAASRTQALQIARSKGWL